MSDTANTAVPVESSPKVKSKRGRRILALIIILILLLMAGAAYLLFRLLTPPGGGQSAEENNGDHVGSLDLRYRQDRAGLPGTCPGCGRRVLTARSG